MYNPNNTGDYELSYPDLPLPASTVHATHPFKHKGNHELLLQYIKARLRVGAKARDRNLPRYVHNDKKVSAWIKLALEDRKRKAKSEESGVPVMTDVVLPLEFIHLDDMMTYYAQTFAPNRGMFYNTGDPEEVGPASQITLKMNNDALYCGYFKETLRAIFSVLKYNVGGIHNAWSTDSGPKLETQPGGQTTVTQEVKWRGNRMEALDMYNFLYDSTVEFTDLHKEGEFAAMVKLRSHYWLQKRAVSGTFANCSEALKNTDRIQSGRATYYRSPPQEAMLTTERSASSSPNTTDWVAILSEVDFTEVAGHEVVTLFINLNPADFGLVAPAERASRRGYELWRITLLDDEFIIQAERQNNIHGHIPCYFGVINDDIFGSAQKSPAELIEPMQDFASSLLNIHIKASRKNIWGTTYYDPLAVDMKQIPEGEVAARVPLLPGAAGRDIRTAIYHDAHTLDTKQTMTDLESAMGIINQFFPTQALPSQIAGIDRAVTDQVAAVQQGVNRRQQKGARLLDDSMFRPMRADMYYNIIQYQPDDEEITDYYTGKAQKLNLDELRSTNLPFIIGQGLKAIDRMAAQELMQKLIFALIQAPQALQPDENGDAIDLLAMINYWTSMMDIDANFEQFRKKIPTQPAEGGAPAVDAAGNPIQPATNPAAVTAPIYG